MIGLEISIHVLPSKRRELLQVMEAFSAEGRQAKGCLSVVAWEEHGAPNHFLWLERWEKDSLVEQRISSEAFRALLGAIRVLGELDGVETASVQQYDPITRKPIDGLEGTRRCGWTDDVHHVDGEAWTLAVLVYAVRWSDASSDREQRGRKQRGELPRG